MVKLESRIPQLIRTYMEENDLKQYQFAELVGIDGAALSRILNGKNTQIDMRTLEKLYPVLDLDFGNLVAVTSELPFDRSKRNG